MAERGHGKYIDTPVETGGETVVAAAGGTCRKVLVCRPGDGSGGTSVPRQVGAERDSVTELCIMVLPGADADIPLTVDIVGEGASVSITGLYICGAGEKVSFRIRVNHRCPRSFSKQLFNGIAGGNSSVSFDGRITVAPGADGTEAYQENHNILLSDEATVRTEPQLEIYADDVKCSHGATTGRLNEEEQFYMRSRGIPESEARVLQIISFLSPIVASAGGYREALAAEVETAVRRISGQSL